MTPAPAFFEDLLHRQWPGNIRELKNCVERFVALGGGTAAEPGDDVQTFQEPEDDLRHVPWREARRRYLAGFEHDYARAVLARNDGNVSAAAREAGVDRKTFYAMLHRPPDFQGGE